MKEFILEILEFYKYKILNNKCTDEDLKTVFDALRENVVSQASIKDIADFYGQSESNVRNVANRNNTDKPERKVMYNFVKFSQVIPKRWREKRSTQSEY